MTVTVAATYENGLFRPKQPISLAEGTDVHLTIQTPSETDDPFEAVLGTCDGPPDGAEKHNGPPCPAAQQSNPVVEELPPDPDDPLEAVIGIGDGPPDGADNHDKYIYGKIHR